MIEPNDIRRHRLCASLLDQRLPELPTVNKPSSERQSNKIDEPERLGNDGGATAVRGLGVET
jgi:hypothetical protein